MKTCANCKCGLTEYNKTDFCSSFCEMKLTGSIVQQAYKQPEKVAVVEMVDKKTEPLKTAVNYVPVNYALTINDGSIFRLKNPNEKHPSVVLDSFHERILEIKNINPLNKVK